MSCETCDNYRRPMTYENWDRILDALAADSESGLVTYQGGDCPLDETKGHITDETMFAIIHQFRCGCGTRVEWGVCIRGAPLLRVHEE
jgi:hypothetical protein